MTSYNIILSFFLLFVSLFPGTFLSGQSTPPVNGGCSGILGDNIFTNGNFGRGAPNILPTDPGIAPGYQYTRTGPPQDGFYTITNFTGAWAGLFGSWLRIRDNSSDPNGYMMVVNASYEPGIFYEQVVSSLCPNTTYEFSADVINLIARNVTGHILPDVTFLINDAVRFSTGPIPQDETWKSFGFTLITGPVDTTLKLTLRNNAPGGIGNDLALDNITFRPCGPDASIWPESVKFLCEDHDPVTLTAKVFDSPYPQEFFQWQVSNNDGASWTEIPNAGGPEYTITTFSSGRYFYRFALAGTRDNLDNEKCRVFSLPKEVIVVPRFFFIRDTICAGSSYLSGDAEYTLPGQYTDSLISSIGCDSIVQLNLTVLPDPGITAEAIIKPPRCAGEQDAEIRIGMVQSGAPPYRYSLNDTSPDPIPTFSGLAAGTYTYQVEDRYGCAFRQQITIPEPLPIQVDLGPDLTLTLGQRHTFQPDIVSSSRVDFAWSPSDLPDCADCPNPVWTATENQIFILRITDENGCTATDSVAIAVTKDYRVFMPNAFSPNGDGANDRFTILTNGQQVDQILSFQLFDRWGNAVFENRNFQPDDPVQGWNGEFRNRPAPAGVYLYRIEVQFVDGIIRRFSGDIALIR